MEDRNVFIDRHKEKIIGLWGYQSEKEKHSKVMDGWMDVFFIV